MFGRNNKGGEESNFWVSYADLMAGLLFVFILLIGAIVSKSILMREDLHKKEDRLRIAEENLVAKRERLQLAERELNTTVKKLNQTKLSVKSKDNTIQKQLAKIQLQKEEVDKLHRLLEQTQTDLKEVAKKADRLSVSNNELNKTVILTREAIKLKEEELKRLNQLLLARNTKMDTLSKKVVILQNLLDETNTTVQEKEKKLQEYVGKVLVLSNQLTDKNNELKIKDQKLADLLSALDEKKTKYDDLLFRLKKQKAQIRSLTGIQLKVIAALKETLGRKINIDKNSGALRLSSNILFDKGKSDLKDGAKQELAKAFNDYIGALITNRAIRPHLDKIVIEGHTDSDGTYMYNLALSQKRALAVMNYLLTLPIAQKYNLKKFLVASGRAYLDPIKKNGLEDKEASRRIEIKFQLKNRDAMYEIERILDEQ